VGELRQSDIDAVRRQLGREPTARFTVVARCAGGHPLVIRNAPYDGNGDPFPTLYWLTCPDSVKAVSRLEAEGWIGRLNERVHDDGEFDSAVEEAHRAYARDRATEAEESLGWGGVGGTRTGVKCLHAHYAYHLAGGEDPVGAWTAERMAGIHEPQGRAPVAAIDQGTNSIRLLVARPLDDGSLEELARDLVITRLGKGVDASGRIDPASLERTLEVLASYCRRARALGAERIRVAATAAVRDASNREDYAKHVRELAGGDLEVLSGEREAELSFLGATRGLDAPAPFLVVDIGGGSTEFVVGDEEPLSSISTQTGSVRLTERFARSDPPDPRELEAMEAEVAAILDRVESRIAVRDARTLVAVAGTATTIQAMALDLPRYDPEAIHRTWLSTHDAEAMLSRLASMTNAERVALPFMAPGRGDVIVAGAVVLVLVLRRLGFERALVSESDILDGLVFEVVS
jgi:exopolyphosphatase/guanosine-5'-triphosphate,3'-diphosphate pyrophosphatase